MRSLTAAALCVPLCGLAIVAWHPELLNRTPLAGVGARMAAVAGAATGHPANMPAAAATGDSVVLSHEGTLPELSGGTAWLNSPPLTREQLKGKVVLIDFWTYSCINCLRALPYVKAWDAKYRKDGLVVIGVHAPEFDFEKVKKNVQASLTKLGITYPVVMDNDMAIWNAFHNQYWPAHYFIDVNGNIRHHHFGEGKYAESEQVIRQLLRDVPKSTTAAINDADTSMHVAGVGALAAPDFANLKSPETYLGYGRAERFTVNERTQDDAPAIYSTPLSLSLNDWGLTGTWTVRKEFAELAKTGGSITFRFEARDANLVLGPPESDTPVHFHVTIDGKAPGDDAGADVDANGNGVLDGDRMYQLVRQHGKVRARTLTITFDMPGVRAYAFTFG